MGRFARRARAPSRTRGYLLDWHAPWFSGCMYTPPHAPLTRVRLRGLRPASVLLATALMFELLCCTSPAPEPTVRPRRDDKEHDDKSPSIEAGPTDAAATEGDQPSPERYAQALCAYYDRCDPWNMRVNRGDVPRCVAVYTQYAAEMFSAKGSMVTAAQVNECLAMVSTRECRLDLWGNYGFYAEPACRFIGTVPKGSPCYFSSQCSTGSCSVESDPVTLCGTCISPAPEGGDCTTTECDFGLTCVSGTCAAAVKPGEACRPGIPCLGDCIFGICRAKLEREMPCEFANATRCSTRSALACVSDGTATRCRPIRYAEAGQSCSYGEKNETYTGCILSQCKRVTDGGTSSTCVARLPEGAACGQDTQPCSWPLKCLQGRCMKPDPKACDGLGPAHALRSGGDEALLDLTRGRD